MDSIKIEQQIPANHKCSIFNGLLLKIKEKSRQNKREFLMDKTDSSVILTDSWHFEISFLSNDSTALNISF